MDWGIANIAAITVICYLVGMGVKCIPKITNKLIPVIVGFVGLILGIVAYCIGMPDFPAYDILTACAVGAVSGLAATGCHEVKDNVVEITESLEDLLEDETSYEAELDTHEAESTNEGANGSGES